MQELRRLAAGFLRGERPDHTLQPTALVHEAYLRMADQRQGNWQNRAQLLGIFARMMRRILINHARDRAAAKRGGGMNLHSINHGDLLTLGAAFVFAFHIIVMGHVTQAHRWQQITVVQVAVTALLMIFTVPLAEKTYVVWSRPVLWGIAITGFLSLALAFSVQAWAQQFIPATHTALIFTLEPVFAWLTSFILLGERLGVRAGLGALCILTGLLISEEKGSTESMAVSPDHAAVPASPAENDVGQESGLG